MFQVCGLTWMDLIHDIHSTSYEFLSKSFSIVLYNLKVQPSSSSSKTSTKYIVANEFVKFMAPYISENPQHAYITCMVITMWHIKIFPKCKCVNGKILHARFQFVNSFSVFAYATLYSYVESFSLNTFYASFILLTVNVFQRVYSSNSTWMLAKYIIF